MNNLKNTKQYDIQFNNVNNSKLFEALWWFFRSKTGSMLSNMSRSRMFPLLSIVEYCWVGLLQGGSERSSWLGFGHQCNNHVRWRIGGGANGALPTPVNCFDPNVSVVFKRLWNYCPPPPPPRAKKIRIRPLAYGFCCSIVDIDPFGCRVKYSFPPPLIYYSFHQGAWLWVGEDITRPKQWSPNREGGGVSNIWFFFLAKRVKRHFGHF